MLDGLAAIGALGAVLCAVAIILICAWEAGR